MLSTATTPNDPETDPLVLHFLTFLEQQIGQQPGLIEPVDPTQLERIAALVERIDMGE